MADDVIQNLRSQLAAERERRKAAERSVDFWQKDSGEGWDKCEERRLEAQGAIAAQKQAEERERRARKQLAHFAQYIIKHLGTRGYHAALASQPADERGEERSK